jgi:hypothetical protein
MTANLIVYFFIIQIVSILKCRIKPLKIKSIRKNSILILFFKHYFAPPIFVKLYVRRKARQFSKAAVDNRTAERRENGRRSTEIIKMRDFFNSELHIFGALLFRGFGIETSKNLKISRAFFPGKICSITRAEFRRAFRWAKAFTLRPSIRRIWRSRCTTNCLTRRITRGSFIFSASSSRKSAAKRPSATAGRILQNIDSEIVDLFKRKSRFATTAICRAKPVRAIRGRTRLKPTIVERLKITAAKSARNTQSFWQISACFWFPENLF